MSATTEIRVEGAERLQRTLDRAAAELDDLRATHAEIARTLAAQARSRAPRRSGRLAASTRPGQGERVIRVIAGTLYAGPIHWGWRARNITPQRFISDTMQSQQGSWMSVYEKGVQRELDKVKGA